MFESLDVFVFTLGLTECWRSRADGAVFPICPGVEAGVFQEDRYEFYNQPVDEVLADMTSFLDQLGRVNPRARVILTVSPVPLAATASPGVHVLAATTYSKSVLRVAAECLRQRFPHVDYFPSYEIITGQHARGAYYADDLRNVVEAGVSHVMRVFLDHATRGDRGDSNTEVGGRAQAGDASRTMRMDASAPPEGGAGFQGTSAAIVDVECDESALDR